jgi:hypothetical protein
MAQKGVKVALFPMACEPFRKENRLDIGGLIPPSASPHTVHGNMAKNHHARTRKDQGPASRDAYRGNTQVENKRLQRAKKDRGEKTA